MFTATTVNTAGDLPKLLYDPPMLMYDLSQLTLMFNPNILSYQGLPLEDDRRRRESKKKKKATRNKAGGGVRLFSLSIKAI